MLGKNLMIRSLHHAAGALLVATALLLAPICAEAQTPIDLFLIGGQSNALGEGNASASPVPISGTVKQYVGGSVSNGADPVGAANTGSAWPSFGIAYHAMTGRAVGFIPMAVGGSAQLNAAQAEESWDVGGALVPLALSARDDAVAAFIAAGFNPVFRGVLWLQGEADAAAITAHPTSIDATDYRTAFVNMINRFRAAPFDQTPFFVFRLGTATGSFSGYEPAMAKLRSEQEFVADSDSHVCIVYYGTAEFAQRNLMADDLHYTQAGYNEMGVAGAVAVVLSGLAAPARPGPDR